MNYYTFRDIKTEDMEALKKAFVDCFGHVDEQRLLIYHFPSGKSGRVGIRLAYALQAGFVIGFLTSKGYGFPMQQDEWS